MRRALAACCLLWQQAQYRTRSDHGREGQANRLGVFDMEMAVDVQYRLMGGECQLTRYLHIAEWGLGYLRPLSDFIILGQIYVVFSLLCTSVLSCLRHIW